MQYSFYYDETEHSRKINYKTIAADNYYDNFISTIIGYALDDEKSIMCKYSEFESKYDYRKKNDELKSQTMKSKGFKFGFASLNENTIDFYEDLVSFYDEKIIIYFSVFSKIEYVVNQLFVNYRNTMFVDIDSMKYSIIKAINVYRPQKVIEAIYKEPQAFIDELKFFLKDRIIKNQTNIILKKRENQAFGEILVLLDDVEVPKSLDWTYFAPFDGFKKFLAEMNITEYELFIDRESNHSHTLNSAIFAGLENVVEEDSKNSIGIRMADMLAGLISKLMQSLKSAITSNYRDEKIEKTLIETEWFILNQRQLNLYKKLYIVICGNNKYWYKTYAGIYCDDMVAFISLLGYMNHFEDVSEIRNGNLDMQPEYFNAYVCENLQNRYNIMKNKLPLDLIPDDDKNFFYNQRGAKVYKEIEKQPILPLNAIQNKYHVLSVGFSRNGTPLITISENNEPVCYRLPGNYNEWAMTVVKMANMGENLFPEDVMFSIIDGKYYVEIL